MSFASEERKGTTITAGEWWPADYSGPARICLTDDLAKGFGVGVGDTLTVNVMGREITPVIGCTNKVDWSTLALNNAIVFAPGVLDKAPHTYMATAYADDASEANLFTAVTRAYPAVVVLNVKQVLSQVSELVSKVGVATRGIALITLLVGLVVLAEAVRATLDTRRYDAIVLKVLGATRRDILLSLSVEFCLLGGCAVILGGVLGTGAAWLFTEQVMKTSFVLLPVRMLTIGLGTVAATLVMGLISTTSTLSQSPLAVLRNE